MVDHRFFFPSLYKDPGDCIVIAHRGASAYYPENTIAAFKGALEMKADMIELDVMLSKDKVPVAFHDAALNKHTDGRGPLKNYTFDQLKKLDAGSWFGKKFAGEQIPSLKEVLDFASGNIALNIEIKTQAVTDKLHDGVEEKCLALVEEYGMKNHVLFSSFDYRAARHLKKLDPDIPVAILYNIRSSGRLKPSELIRKYRADAFNCNYHQLTKKRLRHLRDHAIPFFIYTVDDETKMRKLLRNNVDGIFTNKPDLLRRVLSDYRS